MEKLKVEDLKNGYTYNAKTKIYSCVFCEEEFEDGYTYTEGYDYVTAKKAMELHIEKEHQGIIKAFLSFDKEVTGVTETQKKMILNMLDRKTTKEIAKEMSISEATVRSNKFYLQKLKNQAKIFLAIMEELEEVLQEDESYLNQEDGELRNVFETNSMQLFLKTKGLK